MRGSRGADRESGPHPFRKITKLQVEKTQRYQASIQRWAIIGLPAKRQMVFCWRADDGLI